jgi:chitinase
VEELKAKLAPKGLLLSAAVPAPNSRVDSGYNVERISKAFDFINVMAYDLHGSWEPFADHHAPLYQREHDYHPYNTLNVDYALNYWHKKGKRNMII